MEKIELNVVSLKLRQSGVQSNYIKIIFSCNHTLTKYEIYVMLYINQGGDFMLRKLGQNYQVALPKEVIKQLHLRINDYLDISVKDNKIIIEPQLVIPKDQAYFYTPEWQKEETQATEDIKNGRVTKVKNLKGLLKELDR
ncbi:MAG: AbrB/MazE/SpoVT family DNA-binding domain-containing protein [Candidatus Omnitrophota bacterium]